MQSARTFVVAALVATGADAYGLRSRTHMGSEPDTSCGQGFDSLVQGSKDYYTTAMTKLFTHPWHTNDNATFEREYECWFANMCTNKCGGLEPNADRRKPLTKKCTDNDVDWLQVWKEFSDDEVQYFKKEYPSAEIKEEDEGAEELAGAEPVMNKQAMEVVKTLNKKELLCLTLFTIDDECVKHNHIRMA